MQGKSLQLCLTLCDPVDNSPPGFSSIGFSMQEYWSRLAFPPPWDPPTQELNTCLFCHLYCQAGSLPQAPPGKPCPPSGNLSNPGIKTRSHVLQADSLLTEPPGKSNNTGVGSLSLLHRIFPTQESNQGLLHCRWILYQLSYQGSSTNESFHFNLNTSPMGKKFRVFTLVGN